MHSVHFQLHKFSNLFNSHQLLNNSSSCFRFSVVKVGFRDETNNNNSNKSIYISCKASSFSSSNNYNGRNFGKRLRNQDDSDDDYVEAAILVSETIRHYHLRSRGFVEETGWNNGLLLPYSVQAMDSKTNFSSVGHEFLRRFQSPTIFLKVACEGDWLLPIIVGEFAIEKLIHALREDDDGECPSEFQFLKNVADKLGYEVKMVRITERIVNTYYARIFFCKPGEKAMLTADARPSDAINVAKRCKVPIYVNKQIVLTDAIVYGTQRGKNAKSVYDVSLDSAEEGTDLLAEELHLIRSLYTAITEERYQDAVILRDKLTKLQTPRYEF